MPFSEHNNCPVGSAVFSAFSTGLFMQIKKAEPKAWGSKGQFWQAYNRKTNDYNQRLPCVKGAVNEVD